MLDRSRGSIAGFGSRNSGFGGWDGEIVAIETIGGDSGLTKCPKEGQGRRHANGAILEIVPVGSQSLERFARCSGLMRAN